MNAFALRIQGSLDELSQRNRAFAQQHQIWLFNAFFDAPDGGHSVGEVVIGDWSDEYTIPEAVAWIGSFLSSA